MKSQQLEAELEGIQKIVSDLNEQGNNDSLDESLNACLEQIISGNIERVLEDTGTEKLSDKSAHKFTSDRLKGLLSSLGDLTEELNKLDEPKWGIAKNEIELLHPDVDNSIHRGYGFGLVPEGFQQQFQYPRASMAPKGKPPWRHVGSNSLRASGVHKSVYVTLSLIMNF